MHPIWWSLPLTLLVFFFARGLAHRFKNPLLNPLLVSMLLIIPLLLWSGASYQRYFQGSELLNDLLQPAIVALAYPLYQHLRQIRAQFVSIVLLCLAGSVTAMVSGTLIALWLGASPQMAASIMPKSVTTPIAMAVASSLGGIPTISAICVLLVGMLGAVLGHSLFNLANINHSLSRGLAMGNGAHALGTARCAEISSQEGAYGSIALVICGIITSVLAPLLFPILLWLGGS